MSIAVRRFQAGEAFRAKSYPYALGSHYDSAKECYEAAAKAYLREGLKEEALVARSYAVASLADIEYYIAGNFDSAHRHYLQALKLRSRGTVHLEKRTLDAYWVDIWFFAGITAEAKGLALGQRGEDLSACENLTEAIRYYSAGNRMALRAGAEQEATLFKHSQVALRGQALVYRGHQILQSGDFHLALVQLVRASRLYHLALKLNPMWGESSLSDNYWDCLKELLAVAYSKGMIPNSLVLRCTKCRTATRPNAKDMVKRSYRCEKCGNIGWFVEIRQTTRNLG